MEDLRTFYQERCVCVCVRVEKLMTRAEIERDYAKRLSKLAKTSLGKYETGYVVYDAGLRHRQWQNSRVSPY